MRVIDESAHLLPLLRLRKLLAVALDNPIEADGTRLGDPLLYRFAGLSIDLEVKPMGMIIATLRQLCLNRLSDDVARRLRGSGDSRDK
jgi:hypothetical protein